MIKTDKIQSNRAINTLLKGYKIPNLGTKPGYPLARTMSRGKLATVKNSNQIHKQKQMYFR
jgi:hypothetical protein